MIEELNLFLTYNTTMLWGSIGGLIKAVILNHNQTIIVQKLKSIGMPKCAWGVTFHSTWRLIHRRIKIASIFLDLLIRLAHLYFINLCYRLFERCIRAFSGIFAFDHTCLLLLIILFILILNTENVYLDVGLFLFNFSS